VVTLKICGPSSGANRKNIRKRQVLTALAMSRGHFLELEGNVPLRPASSFKPKKRGKDVEVKEEQNAVSSTQQDRSIVATGFFPGKIR